MQKKKKKKKSKHYKHGGIFPFSSTQFYLFKLIPLPQTNYPSHFHYHIPNPALFLINRPFLISPPVYPPTHVPIRVVGGQHHRGAGVGIAGDPRAVHSEQDHEHHEQEHHDGADVSDVPHVTTLVSRIFWSGRQLRLLTRFRLNKILE